MVCGYLAMLGRVTVIYESSNALEKWLVIALDLSARLAKRGARPAKFL
jgi:hypothetical protein